MTETLAFILSCWVTIARAPAEVLKIIMKVCPFCREEIHSEAIRCRYCSSALFPAQTQSEIDGSTLLAKAGQVVYVLDRDLIRFAKFAAAVLAVFVTVGLVLYSVDLKQVGKEARDSADVVAKERSEFEHQLTTAQSTLTQGSQKLQKLNEQIDSLNSQLTSKTQTLNDLNALVEKEGGSALQQAAKNVVPLSAQVIVRASAIESGHNMKPGYPIYNFSLKIDAPKTVLDRISSVKYQFNHPSFEWPVQTVDDASTGFRVTWQGWGCIDSIEIVINPKSSEDKKGEIKLDQCAALGW